MICVARKQRALRKHKPYHMPLREDRAALLEELVQAGKLKWSLVTDYDVRIAVDLTFLTPNVAPV